MDRMLFRSPLCFASLVIAGMLASPALAGEAAPPSPAPPPPPSDAPPSPAPDPDAKVYPMPEFAVDDLQGGRLDSKQLRGKVVLIDIWATWCGPCVAAGKEIDRIHRDFRERGVQVMGIAVDSGAKDKVVQAAKRFGMTYPIALWNEDLAEKIKGLR